MTRSVKAYSERRARTLNRFPHKKELPKGVRLIREACAGTREVIKPLSSDGLGKALFFYRVDTGNVLIELVNGAACPLPTISGGNL